MRTSPLFLVLCVAAALTACSSSSSGSDPATALATGEHAEHDAAADGASTQHGHGHLDIPESGIGTLLAVGDGYGNRVREAPAGARPGVSLRVKADPAGGWTLHVITTGFRWAPEDVNTPADAGSGHAHLYAGGKKVSRVYGEWVFVPATAARAGDSLSAVLYADDHSAWGVDGKPVEAAVVLPAATA